MIFEAEIKEKTESRVFVNLIKLLSFCYTGHHLPDSKYELNDFHDLITKNKILCESLHDIHTYKFRGQIKQYDVQMHTLS
jgi:hypothetical protein